MEYLRTESVQMVHEDQLSPLLGAPKYNNDFEEYVNSMCQDPLLSICSNQSSEIVEFTPQEEEQKEVIEDMPAHQVVDDLMLRQETPKDLLSIVTSDHIQLLETAP